MATTGAGDAQLVFMFAGQGAQYFGMGEELYRSDPVFRREMQSLDGIVFATIGKSVLGSIYGTTNKFERPFDELLLAHPALFMVQYALAMSLRAQGMEPSVVLGASLGEWVAVTVAGMLDPQDALRILIRKAALFERGCPPGGMLAVLANRELFAGRRALFSDCEFAAANFENHFCVAGDDSSLAVAERNLRSQQIVCERLPLKRPFHCSLIEPLYDDFTSLFDNVSFTAGEAPLVSCASGRLASHITKEHFWNVVREPIEFHSAVQSLSADSAPIYVDLSPSGTLANFVKYGLPAQRYRAIYRTMTRSGGDAARCAGLRQRCAEMSDLRPAR